MDNIDAQKRKTTPITKVGEMYIKLETLLNNTNAYIALPDGTATPRAVELGIPNETAARILAMATDYNLKMSAYRDADHPPSVGRDIRAAHDEYKKEMRTFQQWLKNNPNIELNAEDRTVMEIHEDSKTRTPVQPIDVPPIIEIYKVILGGVVDVRFHLPDELSETNRRAMQYRQGITVEIWYTDSTTPPTTKANDVQFLGKTHVRFPSPEGYGEGTVFHIRARYSTQTRRHGPWSQMHHCTLAF